MGWLSDIGKAIAKPFEAVGQAIAPKHTFVGKTIRGVSNAAVAPVRLVGDVVGGKNVAESLGYRTLQTIGGVGVIGNQALQLKPVRGVLDTLAPVTFGLTKRIQGVADSGLKAGIGESMTGKEIWSGIRDTAVVGAAAIGGVAASGAGALTLKNAGYVAVGTKLLSGKANSSDVLSGLGLAGIDTSGWVGDLVDLGSKFNQGYKGYTPSVFDPSGASTAESTVYPESLKKPVSLGVIFIIGIGVFIFLRGKK